MDAFGTPTFSNDVKAFTFSKITQFFKDLPYTLKSAPTDVKIAYYCIFAGILLILVQLVVLLIG